MKKTDKIPFVSICCLAYNHAPYIRACLDGFLKQKTDFEYEILIHDDASTDNTQEIIREYELKHPNIIKPIYQKENKFSKGVKIGLEYQYPIAKGKYIALCEGDDYWVDSNKLQKQIDFLEENEDVVYSCHRFNVIDDKTQKIHLHENEFLSKLNKVSGLFFNRKDAFLRGWFTKTPTAVFRKDAMNLDPKYWDRYAYRRDIHLVYDVLSKGKGYCHAFVGAVYRVNAVGIHASHPKYKQQQILLEVYRDFYKNERNLVIGQILMALYAWVFVWDLFHKKIRKPIFGIEYLSFFYLPWLAIKKTGIELKKIFS